MKSSTTSRASESREVSPDQPRLRAACEPCHASKVKCHGGNPCPRCKAGRSDCVYQPAAKIGKPKGSKNKTTLERERKQQEEVERKETQRTLYCSNTSSRYSSEARPAGHCPGGLPSLIPASSPLTPVPSPMQPYNHTDISRTWAIDAEVPGGSFHLLSDAVTPTTWTYGSARGTVDCYPSLMSRAPIDNIFPRSGISKVPQDMKLQVDPPDNVQSRLPSLTSDSSYTSSPWGGSATTPSLPSDLSSTFSLQNAFSHFQAHDSCYCAENLASQLCGFRHPEALNATTGGVEGFITNTDVLLYAIMSFLKCGICQKNSMALSLLATTFATFGQLFASLTATPSRQPSHSGISSGIAHLNLNFSNQLSVAEGQAGSHLGHDLTAMVVTQTMPKWRDACYKSLKLLDYLQKRSQGYIIGNSEQDIDIIIGGEGTPLWGHADLESFVRVVDRVDSELAVFS